MKGLEIAGYTFADDELVETALTHSSYLHEHPDLAARIPKKELAAYLNLTPETLSRLKQKLGGA